VSPEVELLEAVCDQFQFRVVPAAGGEDPDIERGNADVVAEGGSEGEDYEEEGVSHLSATWRSIYSTHRKPSTLHLRHRVGGLDG